MQMSRFPSLNLNKFGQRLTGVPPRRSSLLLESGGVNEALVKVSCTRAPALAPLVFRPRPPPPDVRPKRPTTADRRAKGYLKPLVPIRAGGLAAPAGFRRNSDFSRVPAGLPQPKPTRQKKEISFIQVLKNYNFLPDE